MKHGALPCLAALLGASSLAAAGAIDTGVLEAAWPHQRTRAHEVGRYEVQWRHLADRRQGLFAGVEFVTPLARRRVWNLTTDYADVGQMAPGVRQMRYVERGPTRQVIEVDIHVLWKTLTLTFEIEQEAERAVRFRWANAGLGEFRGVCWLEDAPVSARRPAPKLPAAEAPTPAGLNVFQPTLRRSPSDYGDVSLSRDISRSEREMSPGGRDMSPGSTNSAGSAPQGTRVHLATWVKPARPVPYRLMLAAERMIMLNGAKHFLEACEKELSVPE